MTYLELSNIREKAEGFFGNLFDELEISRDFENVQVEEGTVEYNKIIDELKDLQDEYISEYCQNLLKEGWDKKDIRTFVTTPSELLYTILIGERKVYEYIEEDDFDSEGWEEYLID